MSAEPLATISEEAEEHEEAGEGVRIICNLFTRLCQCLCLLPPHGVGDVEGEVGEEAVEPLLRRRAGGRSL